MQKIILLNQRLFSPISMRSDFYEREKKTNIYGVSVCDRHTVRFVSVSYYYVFCVMWVLSPFHRRGN